VSKTPTATSNHCVKPSNSAPIKQQKQVHGCLTGPEGRMRQSVPLMPP